MSEQPADICVEIICQGQVDDDGTAKLANLAHSILTQFDIDSAEVNVNIVDDDGIIDVNRRFLKRTTSTDVISFDLSEPDEHRKVFDIVINAD